MPSVSVAAIITRKQDTTLQILLTKRSINLASFPDAWVLPGGRVDEYERREHAVIREVKEETGVDFFPTFFGVYDEIFEERHIHAVVSVYEGFCEGEIVAQESEVSEIGWYSLEAAFRLDLGFEHRTILTDYAKHYASR